jgi:hypothetical protein
MVQKTHTALQDATNFYCVVLTRSLSILLGVLFLRFNVLYFLPKKAIKNSTRVYSGEEVDAVQILVLLTCLGAFSFEPFWFAILTYLNHFGSLY